MTTSSVDVNVDDLRAAYARMLHGAVVRLERFAGGRNSQVFRLDCDGPGGVRRYVAKQYYSVPDDPRDRLHTEYRAVQFLKAHAFDNVPAAVAIDPVTRSAIYARIDGERATAQPIDAADVRAAVNFLLALHDLCGADDAASLPAASEACFSINAILDNLSARTARLRALPDDAHGVAELRRFLDERVDPFAAVLDAWIREQASRHGIRLDAEIPPAQRTLSPSDFGFHNALRDERGRLVFVDFEYFGWDDPAKMIVDFLLHPAMDLSVDLRRQFAAGIVGGFGDQALLAARAKIVYPLFGLKWCLILLNEFVPEHLRRRSFADPVATDRAELLRRQLNRAERLLDRIGAEYLVNPYVD